MKVQKTITLKYAEFYTLINIWCLKHDVKLQAVGEYIHVKSQDEGMTITFFQIASEIFSPEITVTNVIVSFEELEVYITF